MRTDRRATLGLFTLAATLAAMPAQAQDQSATAEGRSSARIVEPLRAVVRKDLSFGMLTIGATGAGTVSVPAGTAAASYSGTAFALCQAGGDCAPHAAEVEVRGEAERSYRVQLPPTAFARGLRTGQVLEVSELTMRSHNQPGIANGGLLDGTGADLLHVGGLLAVPTGTRADIFRADLTIAVAYD